MLETVIMRSPLPSVTEWRKNKITQGNAAIAMRRGMADEEFRNRWRGIDQPWARLRWARMLWQREAGAAKESAAAAAQSLGMKDGTYRAYERDPAESKNIELDHQSAIRFGRKFRVSWTWLLTGDGSPFDTTLTPAQERVIRLMSDMDEDQEQAFADMIEAMRRISA